MLEVVVELLIMLLMLVVQVAQAAAELEMFELVMEPLELQIQVVEVGREALLVQQAAQAEAA
jgi:hypothetical protein